MPRLTSSSLALSATAALLVSAACAVAGPVSAAAAATGPDKVVVALAAATGKPGVAQTGSVTVTAGGVAVPNQKVTLSLDHGYLTSGAPTTGTTTGARAGVLPQASSPVVTTNASGVATFAYAIARDGGFDDDGAVSGTVTATADTAAGTATATWSSATPLNGGSVDVALSAFQENPVSPTALDDRTYYDVTTRDQFGNAVTGEPVSIFPGGTPTVDYSESDFTSNLDSFGDFWVYSGDPGTVSTTVTWTDAPTTRYTGTTGQTATGTADVDTTTTVSYYAVSFNGSRYSLGSSADGNVAVGTTVTKTVTVLDQLGRPVRGLDVQFFRFGPDNAGGDQKVDRETNSLGQASYSFVGAGAGTAKVTAVVSDGLSRRTLSSENGFRFNVGVVAGAAKAKDLKAAAKKGKAKGKAVVADEALDVIAVRSDKLAAGASVSVYALKGTSRKPVKAKGAALDDAGRTVVSVKDKNGKKATSYVVVVGQTATTFSATSAPAKVK